MPDFAASLERLLNQVRYWEQPRWSMPVGEQSRSELVYALAQHLADLGATAAVQPQRVVPREHDMILPDQLRVLGDDLLAASPSAEVLAAAAAAVDAVRARF